MDDKIICVWQEAHAKSMSELYDLCFEFGKLNNFYFTDYKENESILVFGNHKYEEYYTKKYDLKLIDKEIDKLAESEAIYYDLNEEEKAKTIQAIISFCDTENEANIQKLLNINFGRYDYGLNERAELVCESLGIIDNCKWNYEVVRFQDFCKSLSPVEEQVFYYKENSVDAEHLEKIINTYCLKDYYVWNICTLENEEFMKQENTDDVLDRTIPFGDNYYREYYASKKNDYKFIQDVLTRDYNIEKNLVCLINETAPIHDKSLEELVQVSKEKLGLLGIEAQPEAALEAEEDENEMEF